MAIPLSHNFYLIICPFSSIQNVTLSCTKFPTTCFLSLVSLSISDKYHSVLITLNCKIWCLVRKFFSKLFIFKLTKIFLHITFLKKWIHFCVPWKFLLGFYWDCTGFMPHLGEEVKGLQHWNFFSTDWFVSPFICFSF
jgi:hypothetical protein